MLSQDEDRLSRLKRQTDDIISVVEELAAVMANTGEDEREQFDRNARTLAILIKSVSDSIALEARVHDGITAKKSGDTDDYGDHTTAIERALNDLPPLDGTPAQQAALAEFGLRHAYASIERGELETLAGEDAHNVGGQS